MNATEPPSRNVYQKLYRLFDSRYMLGLSATPYRKDKTHTIDIFSTLETVFPEIDTSEFTGSKTTS